MVQDHHRGTLWGSLRSAVSFFRLMKIEMLKKFIYSYQLQGCDMLLPPQIFLVLRSKASNQVVGIHDSMDEAVYYTKESAVAIYKSLYIK